MLATTYFVRRAQIYPDKLYKFCSTFGETLYVLSQVLLVLLVFVKHSNGNCIQTQSAHFVQFNEHALRGGGKGVHPDFFVKLDFEITVDQQTRPRGVPDSECPRDSHAHILPNHLNMEF